MDKERYYVNLGSREISKVPYANNAQYVIDATKEEVGLLRAKMNEMYEADNVTFWRAHVPYVPYHLDSGTARYDSHMHEAFRMIYELGAEQTKADIIDMGVLENRQQ